VKKRCDTCGLTKGSIYYQTMTRKLCRDCHLVEKMNKKNLIKSLPSISPKEAPLGYKLFKGDCFLNDKQGRVLADVIYQYHVGAVN
jgi:hypothetical protein